jgi:dipeptidyl aminopeptidase/acylaminoacyl peptidase
MVGASDVAIVDVERGASMPIAADDAADDAAVWSPDAARVAFGSGRDGPIPFVPSAIYEQRIGGVGPPQLLYAGTTGQLLIPSQWSTQGILFSRAEKVHSERMDLWMLPTSGERTAFPVLESPARKHGARLSPNGRWLAYTTNESGRDEVVVVPFPAVDRVTPISVRGGAEPRWRGDGRELFYVDAGGVLTAVEATETAGGEFEAGAPRALFEISAYADFRVPFEVFDYDVRADGERFLVSEPLDEAASANAAAMPTTTPLRVILNWTAAVER